MEDGNVKFSTKRKGEYSRVYRVFCVTLAQLLILSYLTTPWKIFPFKDTCALFCFKSTIDENADTAHLIEGLVF